MMDRFGRRVTYLRLSLTNRCQLDCAYCTLQDEPVSSMTPEEIELLVEVCSRRLGFRKIRLTGGEPTLRKDLGSIVQRLSSLDGIDEVALTTNGMLLERRSPELAAAGLRTINVSIDSLDPAKFRRLTGGGDLETAVAGLRAARAAGIDRRKVNVVLMGGVNEDEVADFVAFSAAEDVEVRFIEHMPMDTVRLEQWTMDPRQVLRELAKGAVLEPLATDPNGGPAERFRIGDARIGFVHAMSNPFCDRCNRLRVTAEGKIRSCLLSGGEVDLLGSMRGGGSAAEVEERVVELMRAAADAKPPIYDLQAEGTISMRGIGG